ncbi:MAG: hypothetical protein KFF50_11360 [Desulfatitalea sp.]|nr:hypothetical protein [Desulfatitalea sp.]
MILILLFISIFATVAVIRQPPTDVTLRTNSEVLKTHIRFAQGRAMNTSTVWGIQFDLDRLQYALFSSGQATRWHIFPGETERLVGFEKDIALTIADGSNIRSSGVFLVSFDSWGIPSTGSSTLPVNGNQLPVTQQYDELQFLLSKDSDEPIMRLSIKPNTGFVN